MGGGAHPDSRSAVPPMSGDGGHSRDRDSRWYREAAKVTLRPARGVVFLRKVETTDRIGRIYAPPQAIDNMTWLQFEVAALGEPTMCRDEDCERPHWPIPDGDAQWFKDDVGLHVTPGLAVGDWVLLRGRSWNELPERGLYAATYEAILGKYVMGGTDVNVGCAA